MVKGSEITVHKDQCIGCGACADAFPDLFEIIDDKSHVKPEGEYDGDFEQIAMICPNSAISKKRS